MEVFLPISGYEESYGVSNLGNIISYKKNALLKLSKNTPGYYQVALFLNGVRKICRVHQLVAIHFIDKEYLIKGLVVDHIDRNRINNKLDNLRIVTARENSSFIRGKVDLLGVGYSKGAYTSHIVVNSVNYNLGRFNNKEDAHDKYMQALSSVNNGTFSHDNIRKNKKTPYKGIYFCKKDLLWVGKIQHNKKRITIGYDKDKENLLLKMIEYRKVNNIKL